MARDAIFENSNRADHGPIFTPPVPTQQYWADHVLWRSYKAALAFAVREERKRCREIILRRERTAPENVREEIQRMLICLDAESGLVVESATA